MLWEGGWEWTRLTKSLHISIEITCPLPLYLLLISILLPLPVNWRGIDTLPPPLSFSLLKLCIPLRTSPKKSKTRQAIILLLKIRSTPIALAALPADFFSSGSSPRLRRQFLPYVIFVLKTCIPLRTSPKKSKKPQAKILLLKFRSTSIALAALPAVFSSSSVPSLCQFSFGKPMVF